MAQRTPGQLSPGTTEDQKMTTPTEIFTAQNLAQVAKMASTTVMVYGVKDPDELSDTKGAGTVRREKP
jgi:hypothetical protein